MTEQIKCVKREISMRERVYPRFVKKGKMTQDEADREIATMKAVLDTLNEKSEPTLIGGQNGRTRKILYNKHFG